MSCPPRLQNTRAAIEADCDRWPAAYREAWIAEFDPTASFRSPRLNRYTQYDAARVFTRYLDFARHHGHDDWPTLASVRAFAAELSAKGRLLSTIGTQLWRIEQVMSVIDPSAELTWLRQRRRQIQKEAERQPKAKTALVARADPGELLQAAFSEMQAIMTDYPPNAPQRQPLPWQLIERYRDALIVAVGLLIPERRRALVGITLKMVHHDRIVFPPDLIKTKQESIRLVPEPLVTYLQNWINYYRGAGRTAMKTDHLFVQKHGTALEPNRLSLSVKRFASEHIGVGITVHRLRDLAANIMVEELPEIEAGASALLGHNSIQSTIKYTTAARMVASAKGAAAATQRARDLLNQPRSRRSRF